MREIKSNNIRNGRLRLRRRGASALMYIVGGVFVGGVLICAGVDCNRVQEAKAPLYRAADSAARAAAARLPSPADAQRLAVQFALANAGNETPMSVVADEDIQFGVFDDRTNTFKVLPAENRAAADAVRVTLRRTSARGNAVPLACAKAIGQSTWDVSVSAIAHAKQRFFGIVGLEQLTLENELKLDSYDSGSGAYVPERARANVALASNGLIRRRATSKTHSTSGMRISPSGIETPIVYSLQYTTPEVSGVASNNSNANVPSDYLHAGQFALPSGAEIALPTGTYFFKRFEVAADATLKFTGPATIVVAGDVNIRGCIVPARNLPPLFKLRVVGANSNVALAPQTDFYGELFAPQSIVTVTGDADFFGGIIGRNVTINGPKNFHFDESLGVNGLWSAIELNH